MKISLLAVGSRGDVQPMIALALALRERGHHVRVAAPSSFQGFVLAWGLEYVGVGVDLRQILASEAGLEWFAAGSNPISAVRSLKGIADAMASEFVPAALRSIENADAVVTTPMGVPARQALGADGPPFLLAAPFPVIRTREFPSILLPTPSLGEAYNELTYRLLEKLLWLPFRGTANTQLLRLGRPPIRHNPFTALHDDRVPVLAAYSSYISPRASDWGPHVHVTGYWHLPSPPGWEPSPVLLDFLGSGPPPVYVGMGSMVERDPEGLATLVMEALRIAGVRAILATGWGALQGTSSDDILVIEDVPHHWLFPRVAAIVHHGGAGTTAAALRAGVPAVICPYVSDQFYWARRASSLGAGPPPVPRKRLTAQRLGRAIRAAVVSHPYRTRCRELAAVLTTEDGPSRAAEAIELSLASRGARTSPRTASITGDVTSSSEIAASARTPSI